MSLSVHVVPIITLICSSTHSRPGRVWWSSSDPMQLVAVSYELASAKIMKKASSHNRHASRGEYCRGIDLNDSTEVRLYAGP